jgi:putative PIN family toxin of toxin-antitoxin system
MLRVVCDTNIFISAILSDKGICRNIIRNAIYFKFQPLIGEALFHEYEDVLSRNDLFINSPISIEEREEVFDAFLASCEWVNIYYKWRPNLQDEADNHLIELAVAGSAHAIVTNNTRDLKSGELFFRQIKIWTPEEFLKEL